MRLAVQIDFVFSLSSCKLVHSLLRHIAQKVDIRMPFADSTWSATVSTTNSKQSSINIDVKRRPTDVIPALSATATE